MIQIRYAKATDLKQMTDIHNYYVMNHHSTFASAPLSPEVRMDWFSKYKETGPYRIIVAAESDHVLGYAYSSVYRDHPAFVETIETSIYLSPGATGKGIGTLLYDKLFTVLKDEKLHLAVVGIALPNEASIRLHKKVGFEEVGVFREYAKVNGQYFSSVWMQKRLDL